MSKNNEALRRGPIGPHGMDLHDWFAGQIIAGLCSKRVPDPEDAVLLARISYKIADAMMRVREELVREESASDVPPRP